MLSKHYIARFTPAFQLATKQAIRNASSTKLTSASSASTATAVKSDSTDRHNKLTEKSRNIFKREHVYGAHNYHPLPVAIEKAKG
jgi:hypothetical protein